MMLTLRGIQIWFLVVFAIYTLTFLGVLIHSFVRPRQYRIFHYIFLVPLLFGAVAYCNIATAFRKIVVDHLAECVYNLISWVAVAVVLGLVAGVGWFQVMVNVMLAVIWAFSYIICDVWSLPWYYVGASVFYSIGTSAYIALMLLTLIVGWKHAGRLNLRRHYMFLAIWANIFWLFYPVAFATFSVKKEKEDWVFVSLICFGILDVLLVPGLAFMTLGLGTDWDVPGLVARFKEGPRFKKKKKEHAEWNGISDDNAPGTTLQSTAVPMHSVSPPPTAPPAPAGPPARAQTALREHANKDITPAAV